MGYDFSSIWIIGASSGIGKAVAERLARDGVKVAVSARSKDKLEALAAEHPEQITAYPADVTKADALAKTAEKIDTDMGGLGAVLYCAAAWDPTEEQEIDPARFQLNLDVNVMGVVHTLAAIGPKLEARKAGRIAIVSSVAGYRGLPNAAEYGTTKAALIHLCESLKFKYARNNVVMQVVTPGFVETPLTAKNEFPMPFIISAEKAADYMCAGLKSSSFEITFPKRFTYQLKLLRMLPHWLYFGLVGRATRSSK